MNAPRLDHLTRLPDRWGWEDAAPRLLRETAARGGALVLLMLDIDEFKTINDTHGHLAGDVVLRMVADCLRTVMRPGDLLVRYGGDEFVALCVVADAHEAIHVTRRVARTVRDTAILAPDAREDITVGISVTAAIGAAAFRPTPDRCVISIGTALRHADAALLEAKGANEDRECVVFLGPLTGGGFEIV
ncbi:GGDEF domain-containing protein [Crossiella sp. SN42]|uniref:GGDEF domain-containing protein n=1 Tax=Crossiella sp. SN42 TaxID=2944808 RepID=UPI00207C6035|nr:GGDEF domain-containing protein [Crossiella sp. SN42]MCO1575180.1 GGDEF domain-containing protein [Crossiella sp. SN42]